MTINLDEIKALLEKATSQRVWAGVIHNSDEYVRLQRMGPDLAAEVVRLADMIADKNEAIAHLCESCNLKLARAVDAEAKLAEIAKIAREPIDEPTATADFVAGIRALKLSKIAALSQGDKANG
jgi:hypothetical protein